MNLFIVLFLPLIISQVLCQNTAENDVLQKEIDELKTQVDALESRINEVHPTCPIEKSNVFSIEGRVSKRMSYKQYKIIVSFADITSKTTKPYTNSLVNAD